MRYYLKLTNGRFEEVPEYIYKNFQNVFQENTPRYDENIRFTISNSGDLEVDGVMTKTDMIVASKLMGIKPTDYNIINPAMSVNTPEFLQMVIRGQNVVYNVKTGEVFKSPKKKQLVPA